MRNERDLGGGLLLRTAVPADFAQLGALLADRGDDTDAEDLQLIMEDSVAGWDACAVVADGDRIVSTAMLLDETLTVQGVEFSVGQVDLVATAKEYEGRGCVRALMQWAHDRSASLGHQLQVMVGIPYFYRQFGYAYAMDIAPRRKLVGDLPPASDAERGLVVREATVQDIPQLVALNADAQSLVDVCMSHTENRWRWIVAQEASSLWVVTDSFGALLASGRTTPPDDVVMLAEVTATDSDAAWSLIRHARSTATEKLIVAERPGLAFDLWEHLLAERPTTANKHLIRVPDVGVVLDRLRPAFTARLAGAGLGLDELSEGKLLVSTFGKHYTLPVQNGELGAVVVGGQMQGPGYHGHVGIAPDLVGPTLFGPLGLDGMSRQHPDVYAEQNLDLWRALLPPLTSDLMIFYQA